MEKYRPQQIEKKWQEIWGEARLYQATDFGKKPKFYALVEFPYPSGEGLHIGHAFTFTILDILARKKRMEGYNILYPMGWDAFGLPTENYAIRTGTHPQVATKKNTARFRRQMDRLAFAYDWDREIDTTDPSYYKWTQWVFIQLFKHGLAYKKKMPINWCPSCKIGLANEEVVDGKCERCGTRVTRKELEQWFLKITTYADRLANDLDLVDFPKSVTAAQRNWIGRSEGVTINFPVDKGKSSISVFTTRPDTLFGTTFLVLAPEHPTVKRLTKPQHKREVENYINEAGKKMEFDRTIEIKKKTGVFTGSYVKNPLSEENIPVYVADFVVMSYGTGAVMGVPGHDPRDWDFAKQHGLKIREVIAGGNVKKEAYTGEGVLINSGEYSGLDSKTARGKISKDLRARGLASSTVQYHIRDWIFSRQHYWGEPIPMVYCKNCAEKRITFWGTDEGKNFKHLFKPPEGLEGWFPVSEGSLPTKLPNVEHYQPTGTGKSPLAAVKGWIDTRCPHCGGPARRETDTMPNWAGSSWYFLRYCDPKNDETLAGGKKLDYWMPVDLYLGGSEHTTLHLLYSRFWHKFLFDLGLVPKSEPYAKRRVHGVVLGEDGYRMSKSRGNIINPEDMVEKFGADTLRTYLMFMGPYNATMPWDTKGVRGCCRFLNRVWYLAQAKDKPDETSKSLCLALARLIKKVGEDIEDLKFNTAVAAMMGFINDWAVDEKGLSVKDTKIFLQLLAPFAPHMTEELWQEFANSSIHTQPWPKFDPDLIREETITIVVQINSKLRDKLEFPRGVGENEVKQKALDSAKVQRHLPLQHHPKIKKTVFVPGRLINFVTK